MLIFSKLNQWFKTKNKTKSKAYDPLISAHSDAPSWQTNKNRWWTGQKLPSPGNTIEGGVLSGNGFWLNKTKKNTLVSHTYARYFSKGRAWISDSTTKELSLQGNKGILIHNRSDNITESRKVWENHFNVSMKTKWTQLVDSGRFCKHMSLCNTKAK